MINRIQRLLARIDYQGPWTFEALNRFSVANQILASAQASAASLASAASQASAASNGIGDSPMPGAFPLPGPLPLPALSPEEARTIEEIQDEIPWYNLEIELNAELNTRPAPNAMGNVAPAGSRYFQISVPDDINRFSICLQDVIRQYPTRGIPAPIHSPNEPVQEYYLNQVNSIRDFHGLIRTVLREESGIIKLTYAFVMIVENPDADGDRAASYSLVSSKENKKYSIPSTINLLNPHRAETEQKLHQYLDHQIDHMLTYRMANMTSSARFIAITNFAIYVSRMAAVGGKEFPIPRKIMTSKNVAIYKADNNLCFWFIVGILHENVNFHSLNERHKVDIAKRNFKRFNPGLVANTYPGVDVEKELVNFA
jgi:hypothetical protein